MKKIALGSALFLLAVFLSGCAAYHFQHGKPPNDKGYVALRDNTAILEYTAGKDNAVPADLKLAKQRFKRRRVIVEDYYKKMGYIYNNFKFAVWDRCFLFAGFVTSVFRLPFIAIDDYRYEHNPEYKRQVDKRIAEQDALEQARIAKLKNELSTYIQQDLAREVPAK